MSLFYIYALCFIPPLSVLKNGTCICSFFLSRVITSPVLCHGIALQNQFCCERLVVPCFLLFLSVFLLFMVYYEERILIFNQSISLPICLIFWIFLYHQSRPYSASPPLHFTRLLPLNKSILFREHHALVENAGDERTAHFYICRSLCLLAGTYYPHAGSYV